MSAGFLKSHFHLPTAGKEFHDLLDRLGRIGAKQGPGLKSAQGIANQDPADGHGNFSRVIPNRCTGGHLDFSSALPIPMHPQRFPLGLAAFESGRTFWQPSAFQARTTLPALWTLWSGSKESRMEYAISWCV